ncbi:hypothetical protein JXA12_05990 [Candidatus Woesearchaeota archaeon]|nr:hypothetical protein [Candidatus Woesearchaeota archaeon]
MHYPSPQEEAFPEGTNEEKPSTARNRTPTGQPPAPSIRRTKPITAHEVMRMHNDTSYIKELTFQQIKALTQASQERLRSFDRQFSGCAEVIA